MHPLFSVEEVLARLGQTREQGCLLVHKAAELIHIYVRDGVVIRAESGAKEGEAAVDHALHLKEAAYTWIRGIQPPDANKIIQLKILEITAKHGNIAKPRMTQPIEQTSRLEGVPKKEMDFAFRYFLVPENRPTEKIYLTKVSTVLGRDKTSDVVVDNNDVSWRHCLLDIQTRGAFILDLDSTNGTFVNGVLVKNANLNPGDRIELGPSGFVINREPIERYG